MASQITRTGIFRADKLLDELVAAGLTITLFESVGQPLASQVMLTLGGTTTAAQVDSVIAAHNPNTPSTSETTQTTDTATLSDLATQYTAMVTALDAIQADMATLKTHATTLSGVTVSGTLAQTQATVQANLRALGADLGTLVDDVKQFAVGSERVLKAVRVFVRRASA